ncbi:MAG: hypothetical protein HY538_04965 [Deltaproteobacteria bacterium]|nr:hypothetical protein [Deltaproteobacteria bacterium]
MEKKLKPLDVLDRLQQRQVRIFSPEEFRRIFSVSLRATQEFIKDHQKDLFVKLRNGLYTLRMNFPNEFEIANRLYQPSYVSFEYALAHHHMIPEVVYTITSATTRITRSFVARGMLFEYSKIKSMAYRGYSCEGKDGATILVAGPEKALVDYLYFVDLKLKAWNDRLALRKINKKLVLQYASYFERESLNKRIKDLL